MSNFETKLLSMLGDDRLSAYSLRRLMRNYLSAGDVDRLLERLVREGAVICEDYTYRRFKDPNNPNNWEQA